MSRDLTTRTLRPAGFLSTAACCLAVLTAVPATAAETGSPFLFSSESLGVVAGFGEAGDSAALPMVLDHGVALPFDLGGSDTRKLQLQLDRPLSLQAGMSSRLHDTGSDLLGLDATLSVPVSNDVTLGAGVSRSLTNAHFQALGSIQCVNGTLRADSYTASGCRFVNERFASAGQEQFDLGAHFDFGNASASLGWFAQQSEFGASNVRQLNAPGTRLAMADSLLSPNLGNPLLSPSASDPLQYLNSEASGVDLNFKVGIATDTRGDLQLGLAFSRILEADYAGLYAQDSEAFSWTLAAPYDTAKMNLEWSKGAFSTGVQGFYRDSVDFLNRNSLDSLTTFDVHFTWRTPWNANLSVGASNVLNAGADSNAGAENPPADPLESIYGRIPYVRYKQDL